jgi:phospholipase/carboxylesterase
MPPPIAPLPQVTEARWRVPWREALAYWKPAAAALVVVLLLARWLGSGGTVRVGARPGPGRTVLVLLHGYGASGDDLVGLAEELSKALPEATFLLPPGPHRVMVTGRAWLPDFTEPSLEAYQTRLGAELDATTRNVWSVVEEARKKGASCRDIYLGGFSQGGRIAVEVALRAPPDCALGGLIVLSGGDLNHAQLPSAAGRPKLRVLVAHGHRDGVVRFGVGQALARDLVAGGHDVQWLPFDGPHTIPPEARRAIPRFLRGELVAETLLP